MINVKSWKGIHKGINFEICCHMLDAEGGPWWNTYIILNNHCNPKYLEYLWVDKFEEYERYNGKIVKYQNPKDDWECCSWNGGQTFYEQKIDENHEFKSIKIGDDYQHSWDYERSREHLNEDWLMNKCIKMIDELIEHMTMQGITDDR